MRVENHYRSGRSWPTGIACRSTKFRPIVDVLKALNLIPHLKPISPCPPIPARSIISREDSADQGEKWPYQFPPKWSPVPPVCPSEPVLSRCWIHCDCAHMRAAVIYVQVATAVDAVGHMLGELHK